MNAYVFKYGRETTVVAETIDEAKAVYERRFPFHEPGHTHVTYLNPPIFGDMNGLAEAQNIEARDAVQSILDAGLDVKWKLDLQQAVAAYQESKNRRCRRVGE